jgi:hypothetical protein
MSLLTSQPRSITTGAQRRPIRTRTRPALGADHSRTQFAGGASQRELVQLSLLAIPDLVD